MALHRSRQQGAALVIGLILLVVITVLAVSGMNTATTELAMARNDQNAENAFQAAETGIETAIGQPAFDPDNTVTITQSINNNHETVTSTITFVRQTIPTDEAAFSLGGDNDFGANHFTIRADAESNRLPGGNTDRDASAIHTQGFFVIGPRLQRLQFN